MDMDDRDHTAAAGRLARLDRGVTEWMARWGPRLLRVSLGVIFLWFGVLKFFPGLSPADDLATRTIATLTLGLVPAGVSRPALAGLETLIGVLLIAGVGLRLAVGLLLFQMLGTLTPLALFPGETWRRFPVAPTLEGQYILKNAVLITAGMVVGGMVRGGRLIADPHAARAARPGED